jgi:hypothetical protein
MIVLKKARVQRQNDIDIYKANYIRTIVHPQASQSARLCNTINSPSLSPSRPDCGTTCLGEPCYPPLSILSSCQTGRAHQNIQNMKRLIIFLQSKITPGPQLQILSICPGPSFSVPPEAPALTHTKHNFKCRIGSAFSRPRSRSVKSRPNLTLHLTQMSLQKKRS